MRKLCFLLALSALAATVWGLSAPESAKREADFKSTNLTGWSTSTLILDEVIELSEDNMKIVDMSPDAYLYIKTRSGLSETALEAAPGPDGVPRVRLWIRGNEKRNADRHEKTIGTLINDAALDFGLGAPSEMRRLYETNGIISALDRFKRIRSSSGKVFVLSQFVSTGSLDEDEYIPIIRATGEVSSSSDLSKLLVFLSGNTPDTRPLTIALFEAADSIKSSGDTAYALSEIASGRQLDSASAAAMARAAGKIPSSSDATFTLSVLAQNMPFEETALSAYLDAALRISSSSDKRHALGYIANHELSVAMQNSYIRTASTIASSSDRSSSLIELSERQMIGSSAVSTFMEAIGSIPSSSDATRALISYVRSQSEFTEIDVDRSLNVARVVPYISSSSDKSACLKTLSEHMPADPRVVEEYLSAAATIASSSDKEYAIRSLLSVAGLGGAELDAIQEFIDTSMPSSRENLSARVNELR